jgi:hypothetical protein
MSSIKRPNNWLCVAAFAAAFWITLRVMAATPMPPPSETAAAENVSDHEIRDPALDRLISRFANRAPTVLGSRAR